jgi:hypothetical protein
MWIKAIILIALFLIIASLFSALFYLNKDKGTGMRTAKALTIRICLSFGLFAFLLAGYFSGIIGHH